MIAVALRMILYRNYFAALREEPILTDEILEKVLIKGATEELKDYAKYSLEDMLEFVTDYIYEKYLEILKDLFENCERKKNNPDLVSSKKKNRDKKKRKPKTSSSKKTDENANDEATDLQDSTSVDSPLPPKREPPPPIPRLNSEDIKIERRDSVDKDIPIITGPPKREPPPIVPRRPSVVETIKVNIEKDIPMVGAPLSNPTANRAKIQQKRKPPTRRPVVNARPSQMGLVNPTVTNQNNTQN